MPLRPAISHVVELSPSHHALLLCHVPTLLQPNMVQRIYRIRQALTRRSRRRIQEICGRGSMHCMKDEAAGVLRSYLHNVRSVTQKQTVAGPETLRKDCSFYIPMSFSSLHMFAFFG